MMPESIKRTEVCTVFTCSISWLQVMVHIADCPCHGSQYHNNVNDNYQAGDPAGINHVQMMEKVVEHDIQYCRVLPTLVSSGSIGQHPLKSDYHPLKSNQYYLVFFTNSLEIYSNITHIITV